MVASLNEFTAHPYLIPANPMLSVYIWAKLKGPDYALFAGKTALNGIAAVAKKTFAPFATMAAWVAAPVIYTWGPVNWLVNTVATPVAEKAVQASGLRVPAPFQMLFAYLGYEEAKKSFSKNPIDLKKAAVFSAVALYASQDTTAQTIVRSAMTPTVLATLGACVALDYANTVAKEGRVIPSAVSEMASGTWKKIETVSSMIRSKPQASKAAPAA